VGVQVYWVDNHFHPENSVPTRPLPDDFLKNLFHALVIAQDAGLAVRESRDRVARAFGCTLDVVRFAEREGLDHQWFPLG